ncbi:uncharacterized protein VTP21DRAFT_2275 [Calcarisporiella thermophila]|uniref:uncharacterized protein n=1 Tax=Calcarisporiella thermophila TaxID=911321 RepID=UPI00374219F7
MSLLIKNGLVILKDSAQITDILIKDDVIERISPNINITDVDIIDASGMIVSPGFVDTHRHLWQAAERGKFADDTLWQYLAKHIMGNAMYYEAEDVYWCQLAGALEALDAGITTIVDHAHISLSPEHVEQGLKASVDSGLRITYCLARQIFPAPEGKIETNEWQLDLIENLAKKDFGRVSMGIAHDLIYRLPHEAPKILELSENYHMLITAHVVNNYHPGVITRFAELNFITPRLLISHANGISENDIALLKSHDCGISSTPETEMQMDLGAPVGMQLYKVGCRVGLGVDGGAFQSGGLLSAMRLTLQQYRASQIDLLHERGKIPTAMPAKCRDIFYLATQGSARAMRAENQLGSIEVGKKADIVLFRTDTPNMLCADQVDPVSALVMHAQVSDIDTVIVGGEILKRGGKLLKHDWSRIAREVRKVKERVDARMRESGIDWIQHTENMKRVMGWESRFENIL